jgi:hypothetical protein
LASDEGPLRTPGRAVPIGGGECSAAAPVSSRLRWETWSCGYV